MTLAAAPDLFVLSGDVPIRYREVGRGEPVVLMHGFTQSLDEWRGVADRLAADYRVVAFDWRGAGRSGKLDDPARYGDAMLADVASLLDHLGVERAHVVGHSMGARGAAAFAVRYPDRVRSLVLAAGPFEDAAATAALFAPWIAGLEAGEGVRPMLASLFPGLSRAEL
jgi:pimeloyl-ACP methyl ester carboxylesterase